MPTVLKPGDPEFDKIVNNVDKASIAKPVQFTVVGRPRFELHWAHQGQDETLTKLVYHFKRIAYKTMLEVGEALHKIIHDKLMPPYPIRCLADRSPLADTNLEYRSQWDFIVLNVPAMYIKIYHDAIMKTIMGIE